MINERSEPPKELQNKKANSTKFKQCGWCKYAMGSHRYNYCIEGRCQLMEYDNTVTWETKCKFINVFDITIDRIIESKKYSIKDRENSIERLKDEIKVLEKIKEKSIKGIPPLPNDRKADHFNIDDEVAVYFEKEIDNKEYIGAINKNGKISKFSKWYFGNVKDGYRHHDGCVSYRLNGIGPQTANDKVFPFEKGFWGSGYAIPTVMLKSEYDYFKKHKKHYKMWCKKAYDKKFNGEILKVAEIK